MISSIKTPGVYINEINAFPPSIAQVKTAVPAFIGYTEKGSISPITPVKIRSLLEYIQFFGGAATPQNINLNFTVTESKFKLYNSLRLFFTNGGGECYIVSIGKYSDVPTFNAANKDAFISGLATLENEDEPTLLLFPDAINFTAPLLKDIQTSALAQCANLMDRFTILDIIESTSDPLKSKLDQSVAAFRDGIGTQNLKYGAVYYPSLFTSFPNQFRFSEVNSTFDFKVSNPSLVASITTFESLHTDASGLVTIWDNASPNKTKQTPLTDEIEVKTYIQKCWDMLSLLADPTVLTNAGLVNFATGFISSSLKKYAQKLFDFETKYDAIEDSGTYALVDTSGFDLPSWNAGAAFAVTATGNQYTDLLTSNPSPGSDDDESYPLIKGQLDKLHNQILNALNNTITAIQSYELSEENNLIAQLPNYTGIIDKLNKNMNIVPPSGAIAGIYAKTDATRGVWKAPANISISGIIGLTDDINDKTQEDMNIHETGKSVNAIRKFTGRGQLVWGARTLDGNSNDWRYINVRRLANMIEESAKKACMNFVFEPNVKNTWVNVKGMIENYLTTLWSDGALAGAKPEHAFFVSVGIDETMSALDILEGRMIVKIGYAPSRPAEFIILEFTQMQQKS